MKKLTIFVIISVLSAINIGWVLGKIYKNEKSSEKAREVRSEETLSEKVVDEVEKKEIVQLSLEKPEPVVLPGHYRVRVNYDLTVAQAVVAGKYDSKSELTDDKDKRSGYKTIDIFLVDFQKDMYSADGEVHVRLAEKGLRSLELRELLALGATFPDLQSKYVIVGLDKGVPGPCDVSYPTLYSHSAYPSMGSGSEMSGGKRFFTYITMVNLSGCNIEFRPSHVKKGVTVFAGTKAR